MVMGMTYEQYWESNPYLAVTYRKAFELKRKLDNEQAWIQGLYIYDAFSVSLANAFAKRGATTQKYFEKPVDIFPLTEAEKKQREKEEYAKMQNALETMRREQQRKKKTKGD